ncbi:uncharacterized protein Z518_10129 [Rhinocladiella mackenziei CBS 650.93]|uniref:Short-chain dehydrogenase/reductase n=1 Tax=Rhinocladiella mackenziei CBS 650.93 TaxID=1442369 RepID=A0A0D2GRZ9_9EURO|nr:uncharacterized protein Z518_10129 [Rhinocladiella mackenziei CBS 650.93]KIX01063.1 hypothetical protein Z518_10129 [Rhinocladiella mackenziei CBS 650.93]
MPRTVLITGCSDGGLGAALAVAFHKHGDRVFATTRNPAKMASLKALGIETLSLDVTSDDSIKTCVQEVSSLTGGSLDILINNAGSNYMMPLMDDEISEIEKLFRLNVWPLVRTTQLFLPLLRNAPHGAIVANNTSIMGVMGAPWQGAYNASKAAAGMFTQTLRLELQPFGVKVIDLKTGGVQSNIFAAMATHWEPGLPANSTYGLVRDRIEANVKGDIGGMELMAADVWAGQVVKDLSKCNPPAQIWRGTAAMRIWIASFMPIGMMDGMWKKLSGLDVFEKRLKQKESKKME